MARFGPGWVCYLLVWFWGGGGGLFITTGTMVLLRWGLGADGIRLRGTRICVFGLLGRGWAGRRGVFRFTTAHAHTSYPSRWLKLESWDGGGEGDLEHAGALVARSLGLLVRFGLVWYALGWGGLVHKYPPPLLVICFQSVWRCFSLRGVER